MKAKIIWDQENYLREVTLKYGRLVVFIRNDSAEIWRCRDGLTLAIGTLKIMASTGVFVRVLCSLKHTISSFSYSPSIILTHLKHRGSYSHQKVGPERDFYEGRQRANKQNANRQ